MEDFPLSTIFLKATLLLQVTVVVLAIYNGSEHVAHLVKYLFTLCTRDSRTEGAVGTRKPSRLTGGGIILTPAILLLAHHTQCLSLSSCLLWEAAAASKSKTVHKMFKPETVRH